MKNIKSFLHSNYNLAVVLLICFVIYAISLFITSDAPNSDQDVFENAAVLPDGQRQLPTYENNLIQSTNAPATKQQLEKIYQQWQDPLVAQFLGLSHREGFVKASAAAERIFNRGSNDDIDFLFAILYAGKPKDFSEEEWQALQSRSLDYLSEEWPEHGFAEPRLLDALKSPTTSDFVKNEIIARTDVMYRNSTQPQVIEKVLWDSARLPDNDIAATALTSLSRISYHTQQIDTLRLSNQATQIIDSQTAPPKTRVVAMQIADWLESPKIYQQALDILNSPKAEPESVKIAAINTLIISGKTENIPMLENLFENTKIVSLKRAANQAIKLLKK